VGFALDGDGARVANLTQALEDPVEVDQAGADEDFFPEFVGIGGPAAILRVHGVDVRAEDGDGVGGIGLAVEDEVGGIEADAEVGLGNVAESARHGGGGLLAGLHEEALIVFRAMLRDILNGGDRLLIEDRGGQKGFPG
jgi:hypothetical protein